MMLDKSKRRPIIDPLLEVLKSRRVLIAFASLLVGVLLMAVPELFPLRGELLVLVISLSLALIGGYSVEDAVSLAKHQTKPVDMKEQIRLVIEAMIEESLVELEQEKERSRQIENTGPDGTTND
jgi:hypothetical protein